MTDTVPSQREPATKHFLVCKEVSEVHCKTETLHDDTTGDPPLQGLDVANGTIRELPPSTEARARTDEEPSPGMDAVGRMNPMPSVDNDEKVGGLRGGGEDTDSSSSHHPPYPLLDDSQGNSQLTGGNADGKMVLSFHERGNNALATDQKTEVAARQSPSGSINLLQKEEKGADDGRAEGSTESPRECVFHILNAAKITEQEEWQHEQLEWREEPEEEEQSEQKQPELEQEEPEWEKLEKEAKPVQEEPVWDREDQKEKRWDELEQEPGREEAEQEAPPPALNPASPSLSKQNWDLCDEGESTSSAEGTGLASLPQDSFSKDQHPGEDELSSIVLKACIGGANVRAQPPAVITSESQNPVGGSSMMHSPTCHISEHWGDMGVSDPSSFISFNGQDCEKTCQDNRASNGEDGHSDGDGRTVQSFDDGGAISPLCREVTSSGAGNPDSSGTLDPSSGARNLGSFGPADPHPVAENPAFPSHHYFTLASPSEFNSAVSATGPSQEDADERSQVSPVGCTDLDKAPVSVQDTSSQTSYLQEAASSEGASVTASTVGVQTPHGLLTPEKGLNEESSDQPSISKAFRSPPPRQSLPKDTDDEVESTPAAPATMHLESSQAPDVALAPLNSLEKDQSSPLAPVPDADQLVHPPAPAPDSPPALVPDVSQLAHSSVPLPSSPLAPAPDAIQLGHPLTPVPDADQLTHPLAPAPSSPLTPAPDADQLTPPLAPAPSSPLTPAPDADQLAPPLAPGSPLVPVPDATEPPASAPGSPLALLADAYQLLQSQSLVPDSNQPSAPASDIDKPLPPVSNSTPPLNCVSDSSQLLATAPNSSCPAQAPASVPDADSLAHTLVPAPAVEDGEENPLLMQMTHEGVSGAQWDPVISPTPDVVDTSDSGATSLAESSDFPTLENEAPMGHSDRSPKAMGQHLATHCGKSTPDYTSRPSLGGWGTSTDSQSRNSAQPPPLLAFSNPIHFLQFSPPSPPAIRTLYRQDAVFEEPQWNQAQAGPTSVDTRNTTAPAVMIEKAEGARTCKQKMEGQGELLHLAAQVKEVAVKHAPLEKASSWPDKVIRVDMKELGLNSGSQENAIKRRAKSKDWHRQGLRKMSVLSDNLQEEGAHKDQPTSLDTVILREKKSADTLDNFKRRHSKLINSSRLLYQEYSDVALNKAIQSQKRVDSLAEDFELSSPSSPRLRRKVLSSQDSYLQRLSVSSNASLWQDIPMIRGSRMLLNMSRDDQKLQEAKFELIMSEASYLRSLNVAVDHFQRSSELQALLTNQERKWLFSRLQEVRDVSASFLFELEEKFEENMFNFNVCDVALRHAPAFRKVYLPYVTNQTYQEQIFQKLVTRNAKFQQVLEKLESATVCQRLSLKSFLILPFQRITRLKLLLQNILKRTPPESDEEVQATQAYDALEKLIKDCNENVQRMKSTEELIYLRQKIDFECKIFPLVSQSRRLVKCGELMTLDYNTLSPKWKVTTRPIYLHLFNDCLLLSRPREGGRFVVFDHAAFSDVRGEKCEMKLHGANKNLFRLFLLKNNQGKRVEFLFRTETHSEKLRWISALAPPRGEPDLLENPDSPQVQCIRTYKARENDELALEKADIIMVMQNSNDGWMEGVKLSDGERGWFPSEHVEIISSKHARQMNLKEEQRVKNAKQQVFCKK
ncbi:rho guanine nucleotide exchange factor 5-like [Terrapene carolina triunguis]|uniref:rho guanine nucleotide exchange factor 5-like n=1 Tax=Terrapene triunguis TaxID=2587831 RepID=UPI00115642EE|nr:rho guanine nucleotide exchange factor 5-like [Terrapene carolina triunguis]